MQPVDELIPTRTTLLQRLKNWQDESSWQDFFDTYWKLMYNVALKAGLSETEAEDVVQETMISVARHMPTFKYDPSVGTFKAWLLNMTRWRITDQLRKRAPSAECQLLSKEIATDTHPMDEVADPASQDIYALWEAEWEKNLFEAAIGHVKRRFDPQKYQIFDLYVNKEWAPERVAEAFGIPVGQVYLAKHRVTTMIKEEVKRLETEMT